MKCISPKKLTPFTTLICMVGVLLSSSHNQAAPLEQVDGVATSKTRDRIELSAQFMQAEITSDKPIILNIGFKNNGNQAFNLINKDETVREFHIDVKTEHGENAPLTSQAFN